MNFFSLFFSLTVLSFLLGCSGSERFTKKEKESEVISLTNEVRLLVDEAVNEKEIFVNSKCFVFIEEEKKDLINPGEILKFAISNNNLSLRKGDNFYEAEYFQLIPVDSIQFLICNEMKLRGKLKIINNSNSVMMINTLDLESYLKGVIPKEMPLGKGNENYEALKAFAICARTYSLQQLNSKKNFDLYIDVRDQVYGGVDVESEISNSGVDETKNLILTYDGKPAKVFYHSTCGGKTEDVKNIFGIDSAHYLSGIEDGNDPYCSISPSYNWEEDYTPEIFIERLENANLVNDDFDVLENVYIVSRFKSGRVNELRIDLSSSQTGETTSVTLKGNNIRSVIRTSNSKSILKSIWFDLLMDENKNIIITGKGYGHGVGLCQWGAIGQSRAGKNFREILFHFFPGTKISYLNDKN